jgi:hypothetical protein
VSSVVVRLWPPPVLAPLVCDVDRVDRGRLVSAEPGIGPPLPIEQPLEGAGCLGIAVLELREQREVVVGEPREATSTHALSALYGAKNG